MKNLYKNEIYFHPWSKTRSGAQSYQIILPFLGRKKKGFPEQTHFLSFSSSQQAAVRFSDKLSCTRWMAPQMQLGLAGPNAGPERSITAGRLCKRPKGCLFKNDRPFEILKWEKPWCRDTHFANRQCQARSSPMALPLNSGNKCCMRIGKLLGWQLSHAWTPKLGPLLALRSVV